MASEEGRNPDHYDSDSEHLSECKEIDSGPKALAVNPPERLLGDYGGMNALANRLTIVNQMVNVLNF